MTTTRALGLGLGLGLGLSGCGATDVHGATDVDVGVAETDAGDAAPPIDSLPEAPSDAGTDSASVEAGPPHFNAGSLFAGGDHTCFLDQFAELACFGANRHGELGAPPAGPVLRPARIDGLHALVDLSLGDDHACAITSDRTVRCWGANDHGQLGDGTTVERWAPAMVPGLSDVDAIAVGHAHTCAVTHFEIWCWGENEDGELGDGTTLERHLPVKVVGFPATKLAPLLFTGAFHTCAIAYDATPASALWCWGRNAQGQLGDGTTTLRMLPTLASVTGATRGAGGTSTTCVATKDEVLCIGTDPANHWAPDWTVIPFVFRDQMVGGARHFCTTTIMGMSCWGDGSLHQLSEPPGPGSTEWSKVVAGSDHTCANFNESLWCWGKNDQGQLGTGATSEPLDAVRLTL